MSLLPAYVTAARDLARALQPGDDGPMDAFLLTGPPEGPALVVVSRTEGTRDGADHLSELAIAVAALQPAAALLAIPGRYRDLDGDEPLSRAVFLTQALRDGEDVLAMEVLGCGLVGDPHAPTLAAERPVHTALCPVGSLLYDAMRTDVDLDPVAVLVILSAWGHLLGLHRSNPAARDGGDPPHVGDLAAPPSLAGAPPALQKIRYRAHRLAVEFSRRHRPTAPADRGFRRPAVPVGLPAGFVPACPI